MNTSKSHLKFEQLITEGKQHYMGFVEVLPPSTSPVTTPGERRSQGKLFRPDMEENANRIMSKFGKLQDSEGREFLG
jgi:hypothetical protein